MLYLIFLLVASAPSSESPWNVGDTIVPKAPLPIKASREQGC
jgi:hypothetical protein